MPEYVKHILCQHILCIHPPPPLTLQDSASCSAFYTLLKTHCSCEKPGKHCHFCVCKHTGTQSLTSQKLLQIYSAPQVPLKYPKKSTQFFLYKVGWHADLSAAPTPINLHLSRKDANRI